MEINMKQVATYQKEPVYEYTIENEVLKVTVLTYGGTISSIYYKEHGSMTNMVASFLNPQDYIDQGGPYLNALVGPFAGRIAYGRYEDQGTHQLSINNGAHHLHGGNHGISRQLFTIHKVPISMISYMKSIRIPLRYPIMPPHLLALFSI